MVLGQNPPDIPPYSHKAKKAGLNHPLVIKFDNGNVGKGHILDFALSNPISP